VAEKGAAVTPASQELSRNKVSDHESLAGPGQTRRRQTSARPQNGRSVIVGTGRRRPLRTLLVGTGPLTIEAVGGLRSDRTLRLLIGAIDSEPRTDLHSKLPDIPYLGELERFSEIVLEHGVDEICFGLPLRSCFEQFAGLCEVARELGIPVLLRVVPFGQSYGNSARLLKDSLIVELNRHPAKRSAMQIAKRSLDIVIASSALALSAPIWILTAAAIKLTSSGPVLFRQPRVGIRREIFQMFKFRTMVSNAEQLRPAYESLNDAGGISFKIFNDPRVTRVGRFLRRNSLDELPQLLNVLKGEMSLVGPRPIPVWVADQIDGTKYHRRFSVLPGLTGLWQVKGRVQDFDRMAGLDLEYVDKWSLGLDLKIIASTLPAILRRENAI
jgi:exopolysaccharide biosynthesis polyprenyl glycosylphosphotransferase